MDQKKDFASLFAVCEIECTKNVLSSDEYRLPADYFPSGWSRCPGFFVTCVKINTGEQGDP